MKHQNSKMNSIVKQEMLEEFCLMASPFRPYLYFNERRGASKNHEDDLYSKSFWDLSGQGSPFEGHPDNVYVYVAGWPVNPIKY